MDLKEKQQSVLNADEIDMEDLIEEEEVVITLTHQGYIKRVISLVNILFKRRWW